MIQLYQFLSSLVFIYYTISLFYSMQFIFIIYVIFFEPPLIYQQFNKKIKQTFCFFQPQVHFLPSIYVIYFLRNRYDVIEAASGEGGPVEGGKRLAVRPRGGARGSGVVAMVTEPVTGVTMGIATRGMQMVCCGVLADPSYRARCLKSFIFILKIFIL